MMEEYDRRINWSQVVRGWVEQIDKQGRGSRQINKAEKAEQEAWKKGTVR
jgi:hypothetical protein